MSKVRYQNIQAYRVTCRLRGEQIHFSDLMAEYLPCGGCGAPIGYFCSELPVERDGTVFVTRMTCSGVIGSQNPRTARAFSRAAEEIQAREKAERERLPNH